VPVLFHTGSAHGIHPSEVSPPERSYRPFDRKEAHIPFVPAVFLPPEGARPARRTSVTGLVPPESALRPRGVLIRQPLAPPMGFAPLGPAAKASARTSPDLLSHALRVLAITRRTRRRLRVSIGLRSASSETHRSARRSKQPLWGPCTCLFLSIRARRRPGY